MTKPFTDEFKANAVKRFLELRAAGKTITEIEKELGVGNSALYTWAAKAKAESKKITRATMLPDKPTSPDKGDRRIPQEIRDRALLLIDSGKTVTEAAREVNQKPATVNYWKTARDKVRGVAVSARPRINGAIPMPLESFGNGTGRAAGINTAGELADALIYLRHAEREIMEMVRDRKISRPDQAHLLTLLALGALQKSLAK